jgi:hypothetical protein
LPPNNREKHNLYTTDISPKQNKKGSQKAHPEYLGMLRYTHQGHRNSEPNPPSKQIGINEACKKRESI